MNTLDWLLLAVIAFGFILGHRRGLLIMAFNLVGSVLALFVGYRLAPELSAWLDRSFHLVRTVADWLAQRAPLPAEARQLTMGVLPRTKLALWLETMPIPSFFRTQLVTAANGPVAPDQTVADFVYQQLATSFIRTACVIVLVLALLVVFRQLTGLVTGLLDHLPLVGFANRWLGGLLGILEFSILAGLAIALISLMPGTGWLSTQLADSQVSEKLIQMYTWLGSLVFKGPPGKLV